MPTRLRSPAALGIARDERKRREAVPRGKRAPRAIAPPPRWRARTDDPHRVGMLLVAPLERSEHRRRPSAVRIRARRPDAKADAVLPHEVRHVQLRRPPEARSRRSARDRGSRRCGGRSRVVIAIPSTRPRPVHAVHRAPDGSRRCRSTTAPRRRARSCSIGLSRAVAHRDLRALDEALIGVADDHDAAVFLGEQPDELPLREVRVLELVDEHVLEAVAPALAARRGARGSSCTDEHEQVVEVDGGGLEQAALVLGVDVGDALLGRRDGRGRRACSGEHELVLERRDLPRAAAGAGTASGRGRGRGAPSR